MPRQAARPGTPPVVAVAKNTPRRVTPTGLRYTPKSTATQRSRRQSSLRFENTATAAMVTPARAGDEQEHSVFAPSPMDPISFSPVDLPLPMGLPRSVRRSSNVTGPQHLLFGSTTPGGKQFGQKTPASGSFRPPMTPALNRGTPRTLLRNVVSSLTPRAGLDSPKTPASAVLAARHQHLQRASPQQKREQPTDSPRIAQQQQSTHQSESGTTTTSGAMPRRTLGNAQTVSASMSAGGSSTVAGPCQFHFDHVFEPNASQACVFNEVEPYVDAVVRGFNSTVFAYGPSGTGKTHSMLGVHFPAGAVEDLGVDEESGVVPRSVQRLFAQIDAAAGEREFTVSCTFVELYCDSFADLLDPKHGKRRLASEKSNRIVIREDVAAHSVFLSGSDHLRTPVNGAVHTLELLAAGVRRRNCTKTEVNDRSSRSHAIITLLVESRLRAQPDAPLTVGKLHLVDLAGSERLAQSKAEGVSKREACKINSSLSALGDVLSALSSERYTGPVPYRNSKLTRLLKDSLGGNSKTLFLVHVSNDAKDFRSNLVSLMYGQRARKIKNLSMVNLNRTHLKAALSAEQLNKQLIELQQILFERTKALHDLNEKELVFEQEVFCAE
jgi:Kinesin motor domain